MMTAFEQMPPERRRKAIEDSVRRLREARETAADEGDPATGTDAPPSIPRAVQERVVQAGLKSFYDSGSTQLKSEMAPLLEELQQNMESGRLFREPRRPRPNP
jgi:dihydroxyacetone kinase DhaKLM complex PTS-EIIA-like component DhaM